MKNVVALCLLAAVLPSTAEAYCLMPDGALRYPRSSNVRHSMPIYLYAPSGTFLGVGAQTFEHEIRRAADLIFEQGSAHVRPYYAGRTLSTNDEGRIVVREYDPATSDPCDRNGPAPCYVSNVDYVFPAGIYRTGGTIWIAHDEISSFAERPQTLHGRMLVLVHELGHALGLHHPPECGSETDGIMSNGGWSISIDDKEGWRHLYGPAFFPLIHATSTDGTNWAPGNRPNGFVPTGYANLGTGAVGDPWERYAVPRNGTSAELLQLCDTPLCELEIALGLRLEPGNRTLDPARGLSSTATADAARWERLIAGDSESSTRTLGLQVSDVGASAYGSVRGDPWAFGLTGVSLVGLDPFSGRLDYTADLGRLGGRRPGAAPSQSYAWSDVVRTSDLGARIPDAATWHPIAMAWKSPSEWLVAWAGADTPSTTAPTIFYAITNNSGFSYDRTGVLEEGRTFHARELHAAAYDPSSDSYIVAWRGAPSYATRGLRAATLGASNSIGPIIQDLWNEGMETKEAPEVTCGETRFAGVFNCILVYLSNEFERPFYSVRFRLSSEGLEFKGVPQRSATTRWMHAPSVVATRDYRKPFLMVGEKPWAITSARWDAFRETWTDQATVVDIPLRTSVLKPRVSRVDSVWNGSQYKVRYATFSY